MPAYGGIISFKHSQHRLVGTISATTPFVQIRGPYPRLQAVRTELCPGIYTLIVNTFIINKNHPKERILELWLQACRACFCPWAPSGHCTVSVPNLPQPSCWILATICLSTWWFLTIPYVPSTVAGLDYAALTEAAMVSVFTLLRCEKREDPDTQKLQEKGQKWPSSGNELGW